MEEDAASSFSSSVTEASIQVELFVSFNDKIWWDIVVPFMTAENKKTVKNFKKNHNVFIILLYKMICIF